MRYAKPIASLAIICLLLFLLGGCGNEKTQAASQSALQTSQSETTETPTKTAEPSAAQTAEAGEQDGQKSGTTPEEKQSKTQAITNKETITDEKRTAEPEAETCTITISCANLIGNTDKLPDAERALVPGDGLLLAKTELVFDDGDSVFDVLKRALKDNGIQMEYSTSPVYNTAYIEGMGNLYEFDAGSASGWCYTVNGDVPSVGCSSYTLSDGDDIVFEYTLDLGKDT